MTRSGIRPGTSLLEVLVGLGIMAVGAIGAFVLFPLSAINVSRALIDDRTTTCAVIADGQMRDIHRRMVNTRTGNGEPPLAFEFYYVAGGFPLAGEFPGQPVFVDPMGSHARGGQSSELLVGDNGETGIQRTNLHVTAKRTAALRFCSQMDGLAFTEGGDVNTTDVSSMRELRYNWLWVLQRPINRDEYTFRMQVVVFDKRVHMYAPPGTEAYYGPTATPATSINNITFVPGTSEISNVPTTAEVRKGSWVMDATNFGGWHHAEFYRVTNVIEAPNGTYTLEVHRPIVRADGNVDRANPGTFAYTGALVVMPTVVDVYERPLLTGNTQ